MGFPFNGDLVPTTSGFANLGVNVESNAQNAFDITSVRPFNHIHMVSGVFHDPVQGQSGVLRYNREQAAFQISVDGGLTFNNLSAGAGVDSVGVIGDTNLTGHIDLASAGGSGFLAIFDTSDASPIQFAVDQLGLSGLWEFPTQGFNGSVVNELTDFNGWEFNLEQYQRALEHELAGEFDEALKIYQANKIHGDIERVQALKKEIYKDIRDGEKYLVLHNVKDIFLKGSNNSNS